MVLVTGGSRGIGRAICLEFGRAGWRVGVHYRERKDEAERTVAEIAACGGQAVTCQADVRQHHDVVTMIDRYANTAGALDVLICNAGIPSSRLLVRLRSEEWDSVMATNLSGVFSCLQAAGRWMVEHGGGSILVVGSYAATQGQPGQSAYAASKAGVLGLVKTAAREWGAANVRVNAVFPGWHPTELTAAAMPIGFEDHVLRRPPALHDVARSVYNLATLPDVSGQIWNLDSRIV